jgi:hypothetical protein|tara:strand:+ start:1424 stop:1660 length:237 start_codon:yes stop_codon:yes gene_type:complete
MKYYILMPGDSWEHEENELGEDNSFGVFWGARGLNILMNIVNKNPDKLELITIKNERGKKLSITEFLDTINNLKVRYN